VTRIAEDATLHVAIIENNALVRGSLAQAVLGSIHCSVSAYPTATDFLKEKEADSETVVIVSSAGRPDEPLQQDIELITTARPETRAIVFAQAEGSEAALLAINYGAKGYVPVSIGWTLAVAAIRIVAAGGTYVPVEYLISQQATLPTTLPSPPANGITLREMAVLRAIQQGKPNKVIAHDLNVRESTKGARSAHHVQVACEKPYRTRSKVRCDPAWKREVGLRQNAL
jgi:DNA-binding NarL/FixJ family response regulator